MRSESPRRVTIQNTTPRTDVNGDIIDAHDGCLEYFEDRYWLYGTHYGDTDRYRNTNTFVCYSSPDLMRWTPHGSLIEGDPSGLFYRPYVKHCQASGKWVLWHYWTSDWHGTTNWAAGDGPAEPFRFAVWTSDRPEGPFRQETPDEPLTRRSKGDFNLFVDHDRTGYIAYTSPEDGFRLMVERLTPDYLRGTGEVSGIIEGSVEAPCMFRRGEFYYILCGRTCCFCPQGSGAQVFRSRSVLGPYERRNEINRRPGVGEGGWTVPGQESFVATISTPKGVKYLWMADLWESNTDGVAGHDIQYWSSPLRFDAAGDIEPLDFEREWSILL